MSRPVAQSVSPQLRLVQRETALLVLLCLIAVVAFLATRRVAAANRHMQRQDAAHWAALGEAELGRHDTTAAVRAYRRAAALDRDSREYRLGLAEALSAANEAEAARAVLRDLQSRLPQDPEINLRLARLDAASGRYVEAVREYQAALLEMWAPDRTGERRTVRTELVEFLLRNGDQGRALPEAIALTADVPDEAGAHVESGELLLRSGAATRALVQFNAALALNPRDPRALAGAADAAFASADYDRARHYVRAAPASAHMTELRTILDAMYDLDPLLPHLTSAARDQRIRTALDRVSAQIAACGSVADGLGAEADALRQTLAARHGGSADSLGSDFGSVARLGRRVAEACGLQPLDRALALIARRHGVDQP